MKDESMGSSSMRKVLLVYEPSLLTLYKLVSLPRRMTEEVAIMASCNCNLGRGKKEIFIFIN